ncbi:MAG: tetratricopeptide repeat protein [Myxococcota bacterium]
MRPRRLHSLFALELLTLALGANIGCASGPRPHPAKPDAALVNGPVQALPVGEQDFGERTYQLLLDGDTSRERMSKLVGVVRHQLARSAGRFQYGGKDAGLRALIGAFLLVRAGEHRAELLHGGERALSSAAAEVARLGREGYSVALYTMLASVLPTSPARTEVEAHLRAIEEFSRSTQGGGPVQAAGISARVAVQRALIESTDEALTGARDAVVTWIRRALEFNANEQPVRTNVDRDEALEAYRGLRDGPITLTALYLRHGDPRGAISAIDHADLQRLLSPELRDDLERTADERDPDAWAKLYRVFAAQADASESYFDPELMTGAAWGVALELYRAEPATLRGALPIATQLVNRGMAEVASVVLANSLNRGSSAQELGVALSVVHNAIVAEGATGQLNGARRTFAAAEKLLELSEGRSFSNKISPSSARVRYVMAAIEARHTELDRALALLERARQSEPSVEVLNMIASIQRQRKNPDAALQALDGSIEISRRNNDPLAEAEALFQKFEVLRDAGRGDMAAHALDEALVRSVDAEKLGQPGPSQARVERLLARVLEQYGDQAAIRRATQRAYDAASGDTRQLAATVLDAARRALTRSDLAGARAAAQRALEASLGSDEIVYVALWLQLLERKFNAPSDGTVEEAYASIDDSSRWPAKLRAWARRRISNADLLAAARDASERTEAAFYIAMSDHVAGKSDASNQLRAVAGSPAIDLMEVGIARDLLATPRKYTPPANVAIP